VEDQKRNNTGDNDNIEMNVNGITPTGQPDLKSVMRFFIAVFIILLLFASILQAWNFEIGMILTQVIFILLPALWFWRRHRVNQVTFARLYPLKAHFIPAIVILSASMWLLNLMFAALLVSGIMEFGFEPVVVIEPPQTVQQYLIYIVILSVFAGICEEVLFRGTIMPAMETHGLVPAIIFSSLLFALFHGSFLNFIGVFTLGVVIAVIVIKTNSLWGGILYHMLNNFYAATFLYITGQYEAAADVGTEELLVFLPLAIIAAAGLYYGLHLLHKQSKTEPLLRNRMNWLPDGWLSWPLIIGLLIFLFMALLEMAIGFNWFNISQI
jgi:uncharacterized protein